MKRESYNNQAKIFREIFASKFQGQHAVQFIFYSYEGLCPATTTNPPWVFSTEFCETLEQLCLWPTTLLKKKLWHRCFPVNVVKFLRASSLQNISWRLFLFLDKFSHSGFFQFRLCYRFL